MRASFPILLLFTNCVLLSCQQEIRVENKDLPQDAKTESIIKDQIIRVNQQLTQKENDEMDYYGKSHKMPFIRTGSGIRHFVYKPALKGDSIRDGMQVSLDFEIRLLDGTLCYSSKADGPKMVTIGNDNVESGIHKGLQYLKRGDKAVLLIPSPLAHGLLGDFNKIPPQMPIVVDVTTY